MVDDFLKGAELVDKWRFVGNTYVQGEGGAFLRQSRRRRALTVTGLR